MSDVTEISICNSALTKIGQERIISLTDNSRRAQFCNDEYYRQRDFVLSAHPWNFATKRIQLAQLAATPVYEFKYAFQTPSDWLGVIDSEYPQNDYREENGLILSNDTTFKCRYISRVTDTSMYSYTFQEALSFRIAAVLAYPLVQSNELAQTMTKGYLGQIAEAKSINAQRGGLPRQFQVDEFVGSRF